MVDTLYRSDTLTVEHTTATLAELHDWGGPPPLYNVNVGNHPLGELAVITNANVQVRVHEATIAPWERCPAKVFARGAQHRISHPGDDDYLWQLCAGEIKAYAPRITTLLEVEPALEPFIMQGRSTLAQFHQVALSHVNMRHNTETVGEHLRALPHVQRFMSRLGLTELCDTCIYDGQHLSLIDFNVMYEDVGAYGLQDKTDPTRGLVLHAPGLIALDLLAAHYKGRSDELTVVDSGMLLSAATDPRTMKEVDTCVNDVIKAGKTKGSTGAMLLRIIDVSAARNTTPTNVQQTVRSQYDLLLRAPDDPDQRRIPIEHTQYDQPLGRLHLQA